MDFGGKVRMASAKNFVLEYLAENGKRKRCLLFGKIAEDKYIMQVEHPLTLYEAFGICLTSLDSKLMVN
jgi:tubby-related protein 1